jgi:predicted permease
MRSPTFSATRVRAPRIWRLEALRDDAAYALRSLRKSPGLTTTIVVTLALGIGANAALFSLADRLFLRQPAGVERPEELRRVYVRSNWTVGGAFEIRDVLGYPQYAAMRDALAARAHASPYTPPDSMRLGDGNDAVPVRGVYAAYDLLPLLGVHASLGRLFDAEEDRFGAGSLVAVIGHGLWQRRFAGDSTVLGRAVTIARQRYTIIGILPSGFTGIDLDPVDVWLPLSSYPSPRLGDFPWYAHWRSGFQLRVLARVRADATNEWISAAATTAYRNGERTGVSRGPDTSATVLAGPLLAALGPSITPRTEVAITTRLAGVVVVVLLIACANVANLLLVRGLKRRRELAVRVALGLSRGRLVRQLLLEGLLLSLGAGVVALLVAQVGGTALQRLILAETAWSRTTIDWRLTSATAVLALVAATLASVAPALSASRLDLTRDLRAGARGDARAYSRLRAGLVVMQAALSVLLLAGAGLFVRSLHHARAIDLGYDADRLLYATVTFANPEGHYIDHGSTRFPEIARGLREVAPRIERLPGVERTALSSAAPLAGYAMIGLTLDGGVTPPRLEDRDPALISATPAYRSTVGFSMKRGRWFTNADDAGAQRVLVVNETAARTYWPGVDPLGKCVYLFRQNQRCARVIGVARDMHLEDVVETPRVVLFAAPAQYGAILGNPSNIVVRAATAALPRVAGDVRRLLREQFPTAEPPIVRFVSTRVTSQLRPWRLGATLFATFGALALLVAGIGVYSVIAYSVSQRTHEMGIRMALGARASQVVSLIVREGMRTAVLGIVIGAALVLLLGRLIASMLYGTTPYDPLVLLGVIVVLGAVVFVASVLPGLRAARGNPSLSLRAD